MSCTRCQSFVLRAVLKNSSVIIMGNMITFQLFSQLIFAVQKKNVCKKAKCKKGSGGTVFKWDVNNTWLYNDILLSDLGVKVF